MIIPKVQAQAQAEAQVVAHAQGTMTIYDWIGLDWIEDGLY